MAPGLPGSLPDRPPAPAFQAGPHYGPRPSRPACRMTAGLPGSLPDRPPAPAFQAGPHYGPRPSGLPGPTGLRHPPSRPARIMAPGLPGSPGLPTSGTRLPGRPCRMTTGLPGRCGPLTPGFLADRTSWPRPPLPTGLPGVTSRRPSGPRPLPADLRPPSRTAGPPGPLAPAFLPCLRLQGLPPPRTSPQGHEAARTAPAPVRPRFKPRATQTPTPYRRGELPPPGPQGGPKNDNHLLPVPDKVQGRRRPD
jgi:hypothetical protein